MTRTRARLAALALVTTASLTACGGGAPTDAAAEDFCAAQASMLEDIDVDLDDPDGAPTEEEMADAMHSWADRILEVGTPEDMPEDAREGFEEVADQAQSLTAEELAAEDPSEFSDGLSEEVEAKVQAYSAYVSETCGGVMGGGAAGENGSAEDQ